MGEKPNWVKIRNEYINGNISYRKLAEKHGVSQTTLTEKAIKEKWFEKRKKQRIKTEAKTLQKTAEKIAEKESDRLARISAAADKLLEKIELATEQLDMYLMKDKRKYTQQVKDKNTGKTVYVDVEEEVPKSIRTERINKAELKQLASALKDLKEIQLVRNDESSNTEESCGINIIVSAATPEDMEED